LSAAYDGLGDALLAEGKPVEAEAQYRRALALLEPALGPRHPDLAEALGGIGRAALAAGAPRRALPPLERALAVRAGSEAGGDVADAARTQFALARALDGSGGDRARARRLAEEARASLIAAGRGHAREADEIGRWLKRR
jgi:tetratricopeptide (TPR) repeat protein